jgi:hypothetical protein
MLSDYLIKAIDEIEGCLREMPEGMKAQISAIKEKMLELQKKLEASPHMNVPPIARRLAAEEMLRNQLGNQVETIARLVKLAQSLPEGDLRNQLFDRISELDVIADGIRRALDSLI